MLEAHFYFKQFSFHQQKMIRHRASMKYYASLLQSRGSVVEYISHDHPHANLSSLFSFFASSNVTVVHYADTHDYMLEKSLTHYVKNRALSRRNMHRQILSAVWMN
jgi:deoxyribodipyrimidine photolyase-related protein